MDNQPILLQGPSGTRDFYPEDMTKRNWLFSQWRDVSRKFGFQEYDAPILEYANLYTRKGGDDILKEMYSFVDREGTNVCLRPEMTPSIARMVMSIHKCMVTPIKWFSIPQCRRFETTTRGRKREHYQWNVDIFCAEKVKSEIELLSMVINFFEQVGLTETDIVIKISNRMILHKIFTKMSINPDKFELIFNIIDKIKKITCDELREMIRLETGLSDENINTIIELTTINDVVQLEKYIDPDDDTLEEMMQIFNMAKTCNILKWLQLDVSIVRGLSYYTGIVFEAFFRNSTLNRSICGGGRYDNLLDKYGYIEHVPAIGFGLGDVVILEGLIELGKLPNLNSKIDYCVVAYSENLYGMAYQIAERLRSKQKSVVLYMKCDRKLRIAFGYADRINAEYVILIAPDEIKNGQMVVKSLRLAKNKETIVDINEYINNQ